MFLGYLKFYSVTNMLVQLQLIAFALLCTTITFITGRTCPRRLLK